jgi:Na+:H+ antiporter, NhaA family
VASLSAHAPPSRWSRLIAWVSGDVVGGILMISAAVIALIWANSPWQDAYSAISEFVVGPAVHMDLSLATWAADGLLAMFFFVVGVELKHEMSRSSAAAPTVLVPQNVSL